MRPLRQRLWAPVAGLFKVGVPAVLVPSLFLLGIRLRTGAHARPGPSPPFGSGAPGLHSSGIRPCAACSGTVGPGGNLPLPSPRIDAAFLRTIRPWLEPFCILWVWPIW